VRIMQRAVNRFEVVKIKEDGVWGPQTRTGINVQQPNNYVLELVQLLEEYYYSIARARPKNQKFLRGWLNRAKRMPSAVMFKQ
jgi:lysozyme family protein